MITHFWVVFRHQCRQRKDNISHFRVQIQLRAPCVPKQLSRVYVYVPRLLFGRGFKTLGHVVQPLKLVFDFGQGLIDFSCDANKFFRLFHFTSCLGPLLVEDSGCFFDTY